MQACDVVFYALLDGLADKELLSPAQSPVGVWANQNSFVFSPVNGQAQCQMYGDSTVMAVYACQV
jgi:hypothetical protein